MEYFLYATPLIPIILISWLIQLYNDRLTQKLSDIETREQAKTVAKKLVDAEGLSDIDVVKGENYVLNFYNEETGKIELSPDIFDQKDITAIGLASQAAVTAILWRQNPGKLSTIQRLKRVISIFFWGVFTILAFGLMGKNFPLVLAGYVLVGVTIFLFLIEMRMKSKISKIILEKLRKRNLFSDGELASIAKVLRAESVKL